MATPTLTIHHLRLSQSERIIWLCEELGLPYTLELYSRDPYTSLAPESYKALHPVGTAPVITEGDIVLGESNAIFEYLLSKAKAGEEASQCDNANSLALPPSHPDYATYLFWLHHMNGSLQPALNWLMVSRMEEQLREQQDRDRLVKARTRSIPNFNQTRLDLTLSAMETQLSKTPYLSGTIFTAADCMALFPLSTFQLFMKFDLSEYPSIVAYLERISGREAWKRTLEKMDEGVQRQRGNLLQLQ